MYLKELLNCRIVVSFRGYDLNFSGLEQEDYYSEVWQKADMLHFLGEDLRRRALRRGCPPDRPHMLIPPALDIRRFNPSAQSHAEVLGTENRPLRLLSVGRLEWKKGYEHALQAVRFLKDRGIKLVYRIVGAGQYIEAVAFCRYQLGLEDCVELLGAMPQEQVLEQMKWADVFLHAAVSEGFCNAVLEAQAMKLPVVCSDAGGLPENVADGVTGFVVPRRNPKAMADKLELLAANPELRRRMGNAGRERVESCFWLEDQIDRFEKLYLTVLDQERPGMGKGVISGEG
jgi:colanic acid/amylovoran biosynthesis glycosyltransferase